MNQLYVINVLLTVLYFSKLKKFSVVLKGSDEGRDVGMVKVRQRQSREH